MTIGPAPMIRMLLRSVRRGISALLHHGDEAIEQIADVMRPWTGFRMSLEAECGPVGKRNSLQAAVEQRLMRDADVAGERRLVHREAVILAGDQHLSGVDIL